jgi:hypothetical protein
MSAIPSFEVVAAIAITSGVGVLDADRMRVFTPAILGAEGVFVHANEIGNSAEVSSMPGEYPKT